MPRSGRLVLREVDEDGARCHVYFEGAYELWSRSILTVGPRVDRLYDQVPSNQGGVK